MFICPKRIIVAALPSDRIGNYYHIYDLSVLGIILIGIKLLIICGIIKSIISFIKKADA